MKNDLQSKSCKDCKESSSPLAQDQAKDLQKHLNGAWNIVNNHHLERKFKFKNFKQALEFTNKVGELAEQEGHHPDIVLKWGEVQITLFTHKIDGLTESDFIMAAKIDSIGGN